MLVLWCVHSLQRFSSSLQLVFPPLCWVLQRVPAAVCLRRPASHSPTVLIRRSPYWTLDAALVKERHEVREKLLDLLIICAGDRFSWNLNPVGWSQTLWYPSHFSDTVPKNVEEMHAAFWRVWRTKKEKGKLGKGHWCRGLWGLLLTFSGPAPLCFAGVCTGLWGYFWPSWGTGLPLCFAEVCTSVVQAQLGVLLAAELRQWNQVGLELIVFLSLCTHRGKGQFHLQMPLTSSKSTSFCWISPVKLLHDATVRTPSDPRDRYLRWELLGRFGLQLSTQYRSFRDITFTETLKTWIFDRDYSWKSLSSRECDLHLACVRVHFPLRAPVAFSSRYPPPWDVEFLNQCRW